ncbi:MAG: hypothetical protein K1X28_10535 [Parachlamydiales bacterium]|nr:hypothetical protein [Parachlamydiales bacterium]
MSAISRVDSDYYSIPENVEGDPVNLAFLTAAVVYGIAMAVLINSIGFHFWLTIPLGLILLSWGAYNLPCLRGRCLLICKKDDGNEQIQQLQKRISDLDQRLQKIIEEQNEKIKADTRNISRDQKIAELNFEPRECDSLRREIAQLHNQIRILKKQHGIHFIRKDKQTEAASSAENELYNKLQDLKQQYKNQLDAIQNGTDDFDPGKLVALESRISQLRKQLRQLKKSKPL